MGDIWWPVHLYVFSGTTIRVFPIIFYLEVSLVNKTIH